MSLNTFTNENRVRDLLIPNGSESLKRVNSVKSGPSSKKVREESIQDDTESTFSTLIPFTELDIWTDPSCWNDIWVTSSMNKNAVLTMQQAILKSIINSNDELNEDFISRLGYVSWSCLLSNPPEGPTSYARLVNQYCPIEQGPPFKLDTIIQPIQRLHPALSSISDFMNVTFLPYQCRTLTWMLALDDPRMSVRMEFLQREHCFPMFWEWAGQANDQILLVNRFEGAICHVREKDVLDGTVSFPGGILAEEMGLGKTLMVLALILLSPAIEYPTCLQTKIPFISTTLIIVPGTILQQWIDEIDAHVHTGLRYFVYEGAKNTRDQPNVDFSQYNIVFTTYEIMKSDFNFTGPDNGRSRRFDRKYQRPVSQLLQYEWHRVILDEAQMVERSCSNTAQLARQIPRKKAWVVTGTPMSKSLTTHDLAGLLCFLFLNSPYFLLSSYRGPNFSEMRDTYVSSQLAKFLRRTTKEAVASELFIPSQHQHRVYLRFNAIEQVYYNDLIQGFQQHYQKLLSELEAKMGRENAKRLANAANFDYLDPRRLSASSKSKLAKSLTAEEQLVRELKAWLLQLRQTCCHPQIGQQNRARFGQHVRSIEDVLRVMLEQCFSLICTTTRNLCISRIRLCHLHEFQKDYEKGREILQRVLKDVQDKVEYLSDEYVDNMSQAERLKSEIRALTSMEERSYEQSQTLGEKQITLDHVDAVRTSVRNVLSLFRELEHRCYFFLGGNHHLQAEMLRKKHGCDRDERQKKSISSPVVGIPADIQKQIWNEEAKENENYAKADEVRQRELKLYIRLFEEACAVHSRDYGDLVDQLDEKNPETGHAASMWDMEDHFGGIRLDRIIQDMEPVVDQLNDQWLLLRKWRHDLLNGLYTPLLKEKLDTSDTESEDLTQMEPTGDEYQQDFALEESNLARLDAYMELLGDRTLLLTGIRVASLPMKAVRCELETNLMKDRMQVALKHNQDCVARLLDRLKRSISGDGVSLPQTEKHMFERALASFQPQLEYQMKMLQELDRERKVIQDLFETRNNYFVHLERFSQGVAIDEVLDIDKEFEQTRAEITSLETSLASSLGRRRYLEHLQKDSKDKIENQEEYECGICRTLFDNGKLTACGHLYCDDCVDSWIKKHHKCPMCNSSVKMEQIACISLQLHNREKRGKDIEDDPTNMSKNEDLEASLSLVSKLNAYPIKGSFGTKLETIVRHILHLRAENPQVKVLVFSQWDQVLNVLGDACRLNGLGYLKMDGEGWDPTGVPKKSRKSSSSTSYLSQGLSASPVLGAPLSFKKGQSPIVFRDSPSLAVFMLSGRNQSAGLTLVCASHVFLVEPVAIQGTELQAIHRVARIGQTRETHVWRYHMLRTVEENSEEWQSSSDKWADCKFMRHLLSREK